MAGFEMYLYSPGGGKDRVPVRVEVPGWSERAMRRYARLRYREMRVSARRGRGGIAGSVASARLVVVGHLATVFESATVTVPAAPPLDPSKAVA